MKSCIYEGVVKHLRLAPVHHALRHQVFMLYLDLDELDAVFDGRWLWSTGRRTLAQFRREDHLGNPAFPLKPEVAELVRKKTGREIQGPIRLLTHLSYCGYCFNPVSFYYCFDKDDQRVETIVAEVNNTPWNEQYCYVLEGPSAAGSRQLFRLDKAFHVSPFMSMDLQYVWQFSSPGEHLSVHMSNFENGERFFDASMEMARTEITGKSLARVLVQYPLLTTRVIAGIHWNALLLWIKGCPVFEHPGRSRYEKRKA